MEELDLKFEINLQRLCFIKIATIAWEKEETRQEIVRFFEKLYNRYDELETNSNRWNKLTKQVLISFKDLSLPIKLNRVLKHVTNSLGLQIFNWTKYVTKILKFDISCAEKFFWTHYGTIDKVNIFKFWVRSEKLEPSLLFNTACIFCLEEYIPPLWAKIPEDVKRNDFYTETIYTMPKYNLIAFWKNCLIDDFQQNFISSLATTERVRIERLRTEGHFNNDEYNERRMAWLFIFANESSTEDNMFRISVFEGLELAVKFFWNKLSDQQRERNVPFSMHIAKGKRDEPEYMEILIFLVSKFSIEKNVSLSYEEFFILEMFLKNWPWMEFFSKILDRILQSYEDPINRANYDYETKFFNLISTIVDMMKRDFALYDSVDDGFYQKILHETWVKIPENVKILVSGRRNWLIFSELLKIEDFKSLGLIINYEGFRGEKFSRRNSIISCMKSLFVGLKSDGKVSLVERFVDEIGLDENDRIKLREQFRFFSWSYFQCESETEDFWKLQNLVSRERSKMEKADIKPKINLQRLCMLKIATSLWDREETKQQIGIFFENFFPSDDDNHLYQNWNQQLTNNLVAFLHNSSLSFSLKADLRNTIIITGLQICHWRKFVSKILKLSFDTGQVIFWTNYGIIDKKSIFKNWIEEKELKVSKLFNVACILCFEDYIPDLWEKIPEDEKFDQFYLETIYLSSTYNIIAYWKNLLQEDETKRFKIGVQNENLKNKFSWQEFCSNSQSIEETMFRISVVECLEAAAEFFWCKLNRDERIRSVKTLFNLKNCYPKDETEYARILFFILTKLSWERTEEYFSVQSILLKNYSVHDFFYAGVGSCFSIF